MADNAAQRAWVERVLGISFGADGSGVPPTANGEATRNTVDYGKARLAWDATRKHLRSQLTALQRAIVEQSSDETDFDEISANVSKLDAALDTLDERLLEKLDEVTNAADPAARAGLAQEARTIALGYRAFVARDLLMAELDGNPFVPLDAKARIDLTLGVLLKQL